MFVISGVGHGLGATAPAYKCNATICFSADGAGVDKGTDALFKQLQSLINSFGSVAGFNPATPDGFIGSSTVANLKKTVTWAQQQANPTIKGAILPVLGFVANKETVAAGASAIVQSLSQIVAAGGLATVVVPGRPPTTGGGGSITTTTLAPPPGLESLLPGSSGGTPVAPGSEAGGDATASSSPSKTPYYVGGAVLAGALVYVAYRMMKHSDANTAPVAGLGRARSRRRPRRVIRKR